MISFMSMIMKFFRTEKNNNNEEKPITVSVESENETQSPIPFIENVVQVNVEEKTIITDENVTCA